MNSSSYKSIALLGTSADPPTTGHKALLVALAKIFPKVVTWASNNPAKKHRTSLDQRHELLNVLVKTINLPNVQLNQGLSSQWAIKTLIKASEYWPDSNLVLVIGSDLVKDLPHWLEAKNILNQAQLGIVPREGWPLNKVDLQRIEDMGGRIKLLPLEIPATASSAFHSQQAISQIPEAILPILQKKNLYGISKKPQ